MKKILIIILLLLATSGCTSNDTVAYRDYWIENHGGLFWDEYAIMISPENNNYYDIMKIMQNGTDYQKIYSISNDYHNIENNLLGTDEYLFIFDDQSIIRYSLKKEKKQEFNTDYKLTPLGIKNNIIFASYQVGNDITFISTDIDFKNIKVISQGDLPDSFTYDTLKKETN